MARAAQNASDIWRSLRPPMTGGGLMAAAMMSSPFTMLGDDDDNQPKYDALAQALSGYGKQAADAAPVADVAASAAPAASLPYYVASAQTMATTPGAPPAAPPQYSYAAPPAAPAAPSIDLGARQALVNTRQSDAAPIGPSQYKPKWYDRLAGGLVGFGMGYNHDIGGGIQQGGAITDHRYNDARASQQSRVANDQAALDDFDKNTKVQQDQFRDIMLPQYEAQLRGIAAQNDQTNANRSFDLSSKGEAARESEAAARAQADQAAEAERQREFGITSGREDRSEKESERHARVSEGLESQRNANEAADVGERKNERVELQRGEAENKLTAQRDAALSALNDDGKDKDGDPVNGYFTARKTLSEKPESSTFKASDRNAQLAAMDAQHARQVQAIQDRYTSGMRNLQGVQANVPAPAPAPPAAARAVRTYQGHPYVQDPKTGNWILQRQGQ